MKAKKFPRETAMLAASDVCRALKPVTSHLVCAGSLRRQKDQVGDVEIVYIPNHEEAGNADLFGEEKNVVNLVDEALKKLIAEGVLVQRTFGEDSGKSQVRWGQKNKFAVHVQTGVPVDLFSTTEPCWFNYLVCRTGGADSNTEIASAAKRRGLKWNPYGEGFEDSHGFLAIRVESERDAFEKVGLEYREPQDRK